MESGRGLGAIAKSAQHHDEAPDRLSPRNRKIFRNSAFPPVGALYYVILEPTYSSSTLKGEMQNDTTAKQ